MANVKRKGGKKNQLPQKYRCYLLPVGSGPMHSPAPFPQKLARLANGHFQPLMHTKEEPSSSWEKWLFVWDTSHQWLRVLQRTDRAFSMDSKKESLFSESVHYYLRLGGYVFLVLSVSPFVHATLQDYAKTTRPISMKLDKGMQHAAT